MKFEKEGRQTSLFDGTGQSLYDKSLELIKTFEAAALARSPHGYRVGYSGGKDSDVLVELFRRAGVKFKIIHNHTTLDAPETVYYVRERFKAWESEGIECEIIKPRTSFWALCRKFGILPARNRRFCCGELKENAHTDEPHALLAFGVRRTESARRQNRDSIEMRDKKRDFSTEQKFHFDDAEDVQSTGACYTKNYFTINPLAYWPSEYLWDFVASEKIEINPLYGEGFDRVGCIGCPMATRCQRIAEFRRWPKYEAAYIRTAQDIWNRRFQSGETVSLAGWKSWKDMWEWYMAV